MFNQQSGAVSGASGYEALLAPKQSKGLGFRRLGCNASTPTPKLSSFFPLLRGLHGDLGPGFGIRLHLGGSGKLRGLAGLLCTLSCFVYAPTTVSNPGTPISPKHDTSHPNKHTSSQKNTSKIALQAKTKTSWPTPQKMVWGAGSGMKSCGSIGKHWDCLERCLQLGLLNPRPSKRLGFCGACAKHLGMHRARGGWDFGLRPEIASRRGPAHSSHTDPRSHEWKEMGK